MSLTKAKMAAAVVSSSGGGGGGGGGGGQTSGSDERSRLFGLAEVNDWRKKAGLTFTFVLFALINLAMVYVGSANNDNCPAEPMVPTYLVVAGATSLSLLVVRLLISHLLIPMLEKSSSDASVSNEMANAGPSGHLPLVLQALTIYDTLASIFSTCWLIVGSVYVYGSAPIFDEVESNNYCDYTTFMTAFVVITIGYVSLVLSVFAACCACALGLHRSDV